MYIENCLYSFFFDQKLNFGKNAYTDKHNGYFNSVYFRSTITGGIVNYRRIFDMP